MKVEKHPLELVTKPEAMSKEVIVCFWYDREGIVHYEVLSLDRTIDSDLYC